MGTFAIKNDLEKRLFQLRRSVFCPAPPGVGCIAEQGAEDEAVLLLEELSGRPVDESLRIQPFPPHILIKIHQRAEARRFVEYRVLGISLSCLLFVKRKPAVGHDVGRIFVGGEARHAGFFHPVAAPRVDVETGLRTEGGNQVVPGGIAVGVSPKIGLQALSEGFRTHLPGEHVHHDGRLVVDDVAVDEPGVLQIVERTPDRIGTDRAVLRISRRIVRLQVVQPVVDGREGRPDYLRSEPVGEYLLGPYVVEPFHRHIVAEPHMGGLVGDELCPVEQFVHGGRRTKENAPVVVERGSGMLHAAVLEIGQHDEIVFCKRIGDAGVFLHKREGVEDQPEDVGLLGQSGGIGLPVIHRDGPAAAFCEGALELSGHEREEIGAERLGLREADGLAVVGFRRLLLDIGIGHGRPIVRNGQRQRVPGLEVRLVEAGKERARAVGNQQRVEEIVSPVERPVSRRKSDFDAVLPFDRVSLTDYNVFIFNVYEWRISIDA